MSVNRLHVCKHFTLYNLHECQDLAVHNSCSCLQDTPVTNSSPFPPQTTLGGIQDEVVEALGNKNPSVKTETLLFLSRCFQQCTPALLPKPLLKAFCPLIVQVSGRKWEERRGGETFPYNNHRLHVKCNQLLLMFNY